MTISMLSYCATMSAGCAPNINNKTDTNIMKVKSDLDDDCFSVIELRDYKL